MRWARHVARMEVKKNVYRVLTGQPEGKKSFGGPRRKWEDDIKMGLEEIRWDVLDRIHLH